jgi:hypothetical protein
MAKVHANNLEAGVARRLEIVLYRDLILEELSTR